MRFSSLLSSIPLSQIHVLPAADTDFYTRSMDLSDKDFEMDDEFKEKKMPVALKIILILIVLAVLGASAYFIWLTYFN